MSRPIKTLLFSTLFPDSVRPVHGIFVETRPQELVNRDWHWVDWIIDWMATADALTNLHLLVIEDTPVRNALGALARSLGIGSRVVVHRDTVPAYAAEFDIALQPAVTSYASPLKFMEYLVMGKAIVALRTENLLEILMDGQNAAMSDDSAPGDLAERYAEPRRAHDRRHRFSVAL
jgi:glycosyltransferase involved in cell wall biosynthesis